MSSGGDAPPGTLGEAARRGEARLAAAGVPDAVTDARLLLAHALGASPTWIFVHEAAALPPSAWAAYDALLVRRAAREPLQHLTGVQEFWSLRLTVTPDVLVPRPETETLVEEVLAAVGERSAPRVADIGTGSGCVALALLSELPLGRIIAVDVSAAALAVAARNARDHGFEDRLELCEGDLAEPLAAREPQDVIAANLPYVGEAEWETLEPEVRDHDPRGALVAGPRGTELIARLVEQAPRLLGPDGVLALEVGAGQAGEVAELLKAAGYRDVRARRDLAGIERVVSGRRPAGPGWTARSPD